MLARYQLLLILQALQRTVPPTSCPTACAEHATAIKLVQDVLDETASEAQMRLRSIKRH